MSTGIFQSLINIIIPGFGFSLFGRQKIGISVFTLFILGIFFISWSKLVFYEYGLLFILVWYLVVGLFSFGYLINSLEIKSDLYTQKPRRMRWMIGSLTFVGFLTVIASLIVFKQILLGWQVFQIPSNSMYPQFQVGDLILVDTQGIKRKAISYRDIVVFERPSRHDNLYVKRVIGLEHDEISAKNGKIHRNNLPLNPELYSTKAFADLKLGQGQLFVTGDNFLHSIDSRHWGAIDKNNVVGLFVRVVYSRE